MIDYPLPIVGFCAYSGTGKTTLLRRLIPILKREGLRIGVIKHAHHSFDIDRPGKDSYELRKAGAEQMLVASQQRMAWVKELDNDPQQEPVLEDALSLMQANVLDLVLVEGFKQAAFPKIELYRASLGKPLMYPHDANIVAVASDTRLGIGHTVPVQLNLNQADEIAYFIVEKIAGRSKLTSIYRNDTKVY